MNTSMIAFYSTLGAIGVAIAVGCGFDNYKMSQAEKKFGVSYGQLNDTQDAIASVYNSTLVDGTKPEYEKSSCLIGAGHKSILEVYEKCSEIREKIFKENPDFSQYNRWEKKLLEKVIETENQAYASEHAVKQNVYNNAIMALNERLTKENKSK